VRPDQVPQMANTAAVLAELPRRSGVTYSVIVPNLVGARHALASGVDSMQVFLSASESHNQSNVNMSVAQSLEQVAAIAALARSAGTPFDAVISVAFGCPFEGHVALARVLELSARLLELGAVQVTLGDTTGMAHPLLVQQLVQAFHERFPRQPLRLHLHSARGAGLANLLAALQLGVSAFDSSIGGIGGCPFAPGAPGNLCTEDVTHMLHEMGVATGLELEALLAAARFLEELLGHPVPGQTLKAGICKHLLEG
jgi:hydroxymethylglutaryl-CoA lyase